ncbi:hypothetical protein KJS94_12330 [Flavihumibacter rivuli]|uniref:hypothetical protein n=1 Tax=Flavihumibacter rivuli TaxID=2838156 RepID=UPI001BDED357|nr:hypothetical protein [Flavihumibacter rivuli]ULQ55429.1 hypothetical protein KJS94_12330 [Flavihumibacter rivuli]
MRLKSKNFFMRLTEINMTSIEFIIAKVQKCGYECNSVLNSFQGIIEDQTISDTYNKIIVRDVSDSINTIVFDCRENKIEAISFIGNIKISPKELFEKFKQYREAYSIRDDLYFYFFNENRQFGPVKISFFEPTHKQLQGSSETKYLANLTLSW